jgi:hypothetical protein
LRTSSLRIGILDPMHLGPMLRNTFEKESTIWTFLHRHSFFSFFGLSIPPIVTAIDDRLEPFISALFLTASHLRFFAAPLSKLRHTNSQLIRHLSELL